MPDQRIHDYDLRALDQLKLNFEAAMAIEGDLEPAATRRPQRSRTRIAISFAAAAAVAVAVFVAINLSSSPQLTVQEATASLAATADNATLPRPDQFTYTHATRSSIDSVVTPPDVNPVRALATSKVHDEIRAWLSVARRGVIESTEIPADGSEPKTETIPYPPQRKYRIGDHEYTRAELVRLSAHPEVVVAQLKADSRGSHGSDPTIEYGMTIDALRALAPPLPASIRAALISNIATIPGVTVDPETHDPRGREARAFDFTPEQAFLRYRVLFDPKTTNILYDESILSKDPPEDFLPGLKTGQVVKSYMLLDSAVVDSLPSNP